MLYYSVLFYSYLYNNIEILGGVENPGPKKGEEKGGEREGIHANKYT